jgi:uncharacterized membrane protein
MLGKAPEMERKTMSLAALTEAPALIQIHAYAAILSFALGPFALLRKRRDIWHKSAGYVWVAAMYCTAISSMFFSETPMIGPFSPIHILSVMTLVGLTYAVRAAILRNAIAHGRAMRALYAQALIIPGVFTFLPGRRMNAVFSGGQDMAVFWVAAAVGALVMAGIWFHPALSRAVGLAGGGLKGTGWRKIPLFFGRPSR